jgi:hypothetical protein
MALNKTTYSKARPHIGTKKEEYFVANRHMIEPYDVHVSMEWYGDKLPDELLNAIQEELDVVMKKMSLDAQRLVAIGNVVRGPTPNNTSNARTPGTLQDSIKGMANKKKDNTAVIGFLEAGDKDAFYAVYQEFGIADPPRSRGLWGRKDKDGNYIHYDDPDWKFKPFLRPAFNANVDEAVAAIERGIVKALGSLPE